MSNKNMNQEKRHGQDGGINPLALPSALPEGISKPEPGGLSEAEAERLREEGWGNIQSGTPEKSFFAILRDNLFTLFNALNFFLAICLVCVGSYRNMLFLGVVVSNLLIGTIQEMRAQRTMRQLRLMHMPTVHLIRDGRETERPVEEAVRGDLAILRAGDQIPADAIVMEGHGAAMESLLTGESDPIRKQAGDWLYSGAYITEGKLTAQLAYVGDQSYAARLTREAQKTARPESKIMTELRRLIRMDSMVLVPLGILLFLKQFLLAHTPLEQAVPSTVAAMIGMIPEGLMLLTSIAMAAGVVKLGRRGALAQELAGIETLARADVLCLDKTGTVTTGQMVLEAVEGLDAKEPEARQALNRFMGAFDDRSGTMNALRDAVGSGREAPVKTWPFSSRTKKSAASFSDGSVLILGAPEFVDPGSANRLRSRLTELTEAGKRVLLLTEGTASAESEAFPVPGKPLGLLVLRDEIRPGAAETLRYFREQGVEVKLVSGDDPRTVSRVARQAELPGADRWVDASKLTDPEQLEEACETCTVFGRVKPEQKQQLVRALQARGHQVAMTGDGVNDIPAMKAADCSMAMAGGSEAARHAAQITLLESDFSVMPEIVLEGRRVINNVTRAASLFLTKTVFSLLLSLLMLAFPGAYPFQPIQLTLISALTVGIPGFFLALEPSEERVRGDFLRTVLARAIPGGLAIALCAALAMSQLKRGWPQEVCGTVATLTAGAISFLVLLRTCMPLNRKRGFLLLGMAALFAAAALAAPGVFFLERLTGEAWLTTAILSAGGALVFLGALLLIRKVSLVKKKEI